MELLEELIKQGNKVYLALPVTEEAKYFTSIGCKVIHTPLERRSTNIISDFKLLIKYIKEIKKISPDVVLTYTIKPNIYGGIAASLSNTPYFANVTGVGTSFQTKSNIQKIITILYKKSFKNANVVFFQNQANLEKFIESRIVEMEKTILVPGSGVNLKKFYVQKYAKFDNKKINLLFVGRIMKEKGIDELLDVIPQISKRNSNVKFTFIGLMEENYTDKIEELSKKYEVTYEGEHRDVLPYFKEADAVILPSHHEGLSNVLLEAAASGRAILASNIPGCQETFIEGQSGFGFEPENPKSLQKAIEKFLSLNFEERKQLGINGRRHVEAKFSRQIVIDAYLKELQRLFTDGGN